MQTSLFSRTLLTHEKVWDRDNNMLLDRPDAEDKADSARLTQTHLEQINANIKFRKISEFFEKTAYLHLVPQLLRHPDAFTGKRFGADPFGRDFLEQIARMPEKIKTWFCLAPTLLRGSVYLYEFPRWSVGTSKEARRDVAAAP
ncbi:MAG: hypothetical protein GY862_29500 [Gammaproteobacteria bacterium]|nr:hypothetical protein [Gammaproteobacteria bacterium]